MYGFCHCIPNLKLLPIFDPSIFEGRFWNSEYILYLSICYAHFSMGVWRMLTLVRESCNSCWYSDNSLFFHSRACRNDELCLSSGIAIWSFLCGFLCTFNAGVSDTFTKCHYITKHFTYLSSLFSYHLCFAKSHLIYILVF